MAYIFWKNGYPPLYASLAEMPIESGEVLCYCLSTEHVKNDEDKLLAIARAKQEEWRQVHSR